MYAYIIIFAELSYISKLLQVNSTRPERAEASSPGHRPGFIMDATLSPCKGKSFQVPGIYKAFALTGRLADSYYTQGDALG